MAAHRAQADHVDREEQRRQDRQIVAQGEAAEGAAPVADQQVGAAEGEHEAERELPAEPFLEEDPGADRHEIGLE